MSIPTSSVTMSSIDPSGLNNIVHSKHLTEEQKLGEATRQFEAVMLGMILKDSMKTHFQGYLEHSSANENIYGSLVAEMMADSLSQTAQFGLSTSLQAQIKPQISPSHDSKN